MSYDISISANPLVPTSPPKAGKPNYLISLEDTTTKKNGLKYFITLDKPDFNNNFIVTKGFFCNESEDFIINNYSDLVTNSNRELYIEMYFPVHKIVQIRSLVYKSK